MGGLLSSLMAFDFAKAAIDSEIALMLKRINRGLEFSEESLCLDLIAKVGPGGSYMDDKHTLKNMRTAAILPKIATREMRGRWEDEGRPDAHARALKEAKRILSKENPARFPAELDERVRALTSPGWCPAMRAGTIES